MTRLHDFRGTAGPAYEHERDQAPLSIQFERIKRLMLDGKPRTLAEISAKTGDPQSSVSAQLRHARKPRFGSYRVERRIRLGTSRLYEYWLLPPDLFSFTPRRNWKQRTEELTHALRKLQALEVDPQKLAIINAVLGGDS